MLNRNRARAGELAWHLIVLASLGTLWGCSRSANNSDGTLYKHGRIHVDDKKAARWDSAETEIEAQAKKLQPIPPDAGNSSTVPLSAKDTAMLLALAPSERHGATDERMLSVLGRDESGRKIFRSSGVVAKITLVKGSEYKSEDHFGAGWLPMAIVVLPDTFPPEAVVYPKLELHRGTSWIFVRKKSQSAWASALVRIVDGKIEQDSLDISVSADDVVEPVIGARFAWEDNDESIWGYCGGGCCKIRAISK
jgi:hypothetical protein